MQLVAYGAQDIYLTGNPQITFFKVVYRRHTNFSMELIEQTLEGTVGPGARVTATISRNGDLVHDVYYRIARGTKVNPLNGNNPGYNMINNVECEIGGQLIDRNHGHWMETWAELTEVHRADADTALYSSGAAPQISAYMSPFQAMALAGGVLCNEISTSSTEIEASCWVPLQFWFCRNPGNALPLIALQYHEVRIVTNFSKACVSNSNSTLSEGISMWANYIYLDTDERRRFAQVSHEYLIEQVQFQDCSSPDNDASIALNFNHPVKELIWSGKSTGDDWGTSSSSAGRFSNVSGTGYQLKLNGHNRFAVQDKGYFTVQQIWKYHSGFGSVGNLNDSINGNAIAVYSFALKPEEHQPSGTCNFSRIDNAELKITGTPNTNGYYIYAVNYNVLRIMSGMGGLAYSN